MHVFLSWFGWYLEDGSTLADSASLRIEVHTEFLKASALVKQKDVIEALGTYFMDIITISAL